MQRLSLTIAELTRQLRQEVSRLAPGQRVPSVRELMRRHRVSQLLITQAMMPLRAEGWIRAQPGRGTFATERAGAKRILWVCGIDTFHGEISPYYPHLLRLCGAYCDRRGWTLETAWLSNLRPEDSARYCVPEVLDQYAGFLFVHCRKGHSLAQAVLSAGRPQVHLTSGPRPACRVAGDWEQGVGLAFSHFLALGHECVTVLCPQIAGEWAGRQERLSRPRLRPIEREPSTFVADIVAASYRAMLAEIRRHGAPPALFVTDDIAARGVLAAVLEVCPPAERDRMDVLVVTARQDVVPYGMKVTYLVNDIEEQAARAAEMLHEQLEGSGNEMKVHLCRYELFDTDAPARAAMAPEESAP